MSNINDSLKSCPDTSVQHLSIYIVPRIAAIFANCAGASLQPEDGPALAGQQSTQCTVGSETVINKNMMINIS